MTPGAGKAGERSFFWPRAGGWEVRSVNKPILGTQAVYEWQRELHCYRGQHLPEALFGNSGLELTHAPSGATIRFSALEALRSWAAFGLAPYKARVSKFWEDRQQSMPGGDWDYTFTSPYCGATYQRRRGNATDLSGDQQPISGFDVPKPDAHLLLAASLGFGGA